MIDDAAKIALCKACTLSDVMKVCKESPKLCAFSIGLPFRLAWLEQKKTDETLIKHLTTIKANIINLV